jgi:hypothetical protein
MEQEEEEEKRVEVVVKRQEATKVDQQPPEASDRNKTTGKYLVGKPTPHFMLIRRRGANIDLFWICWIFGR